MMKLINILENFEDGREVLVHLSSGDEFILYDFEMLDESIYGREDILMANIRNVLKSKFKYRCETKIELSLDDIVDLKDPNTGYTFYTRRSEN